MGRLQARSLLTTPLLVVVNKIDVAGARSAKDVMPVITKVLKASNPLGIFYTLFQSWCSVLATHMRNPFRADGTKKRRMRVLWRSFVANRGRQRHHRCVSPISRSHAQNRLPTARAPMSRQGHTRVVQIDGEHDRESWGDKGADAEDDARLLINIFNIQPYIYLSTLYSSFSHPFSQIPYFQGNRNFYNIQVGI